MEGRALLRVASYPSVTSNVIASSAVESPPTQTSKDAEPTAVDCEQLEPVDLRYVGDEQERPDLAAPEGRLDGARPARKLAVIALLAVDVPLEAEIEILRGASVTGIAVDTRQPAGVLDAWGDAARA